MWHLFEWNCVSVMIVAVHTAAALDIFDAGGAAKGRRNKYAGLKGTYSFSLKRSDTVAQGHLHRDGKTECGAALRHYFNRLPRDARRRVVKFMHCVTSYGDVAGERLIAATEAPGIKRVATVNVALFLLGMNDKLGYSILPDVGVVGDRAHVVSG
jgi:hypothetical protein